MTSCCPAMSSVSFSIPRNALWTERLIQKQRRKINILFNVSTSLQSPLGKLFKVLCKYLCQHFSESPLSYTLSKYEEVTESSIQFNLREIFRNFHHPWYTVKWLQQHCFFKVVYTCNCVPCDWHLGVCVKLTRTLRSNCSKSQVNILLCRLQWVYWITQDNNCNVQNYKCKHTFR